MIVVILLEFLSEWSVCGVCFYACVGGGVAASLFCFV